MSVTQEYYNLLKYNVVEIATRYSKEHSEESAGAAKELDAEVQP